MAHGQLDAQALSKVGVEAMYRVWMQFQRKGVVNTMAFTVAGDGGAVARSRRHLPVPAAGLRAGSRGAAFGGALPVNLFSKPQFQLYLDRAGRQRTVWLAKEWRR